MSWPPPAATSAAFLAARSFDVMWSTCISTWFLAPQSLAHASNQVSYAGTKCDDIRILSVPTLAKPPGPACAGAGAAAPLAAVGAAAGAPPLTAVGGAAVVGALEPLHAASSEPMAANPPAATIAGRKC